MANANDTTPVFRPPAADSFLSLPSMSAAKDTRGHPLFRSVVMRWVWRAYVWRLTQAGRWLVWPTLGFLTYTSASLEFQTFIPLSYVFGIWTVALICALLFRPRATLREERIMPNGKSVSMRYPLRLYSPRLWQSSPMRA